MQFLKIILFLLGSIVVVVATLIGQSPLYLLGGLTAMTAVLLLVFRDLDPRVGRRHPDLGNRMVAYGDWIEMPQYGADGDVIDITLTTVKVQNWDKTITTIPTYALISESFKNWRGMQESGGRRIKRANPPRRQHHRVLRRGKCSPASPKSSTSHRPHLSARSKRASRIQQAQPC